MDLREGRQLGGVNRADKPKPWYADDGSEDGIILRGFAQERVRAFDDVPFDFGVGGFGGDAGHEEAGQRTADGDEQY